MASQTVIVTVECDPSQSLDLALPLDVPSQTLACAIAETIGFSSAKFYAYNFEIRQEQRIVRIPPRVTLGDAQILCGSRLGLIKADLISEHSDRATAYLAGADGKIFSLTGSSTLLGRSDLRRGILVDIDLSAIDLAKATSRRHAVIGLKEGSYSISDQGSTNGTWVNGKRLAPQKWQILNAGDIIEFGKNGPRLSFHIENESKET